MEALSSFSVGFMPFSELLSLDSWSCNSDSNGLEGETEVFTLTDVWSLAADMDEQDDVIGLLISPFEVGSIVSIQGNKNYIIKSSEKKHYVL